MKWVVALIVVGGLGLIGGGVWSYIDEHSGEAAQAKVTDCYSRGRGKYKNVICVGTWTLNERRMSGFISNGRMGDEGKTLSVRIHGKRAVKPTLWISIAAFAFGLALLGLCIPIVVDARRRGSATSQA